MEPTNAVDKMVRTVFGHIISIDDKSLVYCTNCEMVWQRGTRPKCGSNKLGQYCCSDPIMLSKPYKDRPTSLNQGESYVPKLTYTDPVTSPAHYTSHPSGVECKYIIMHSTWAIGSAIKYLWRCDGKGVPIQDLHKAIECINIELERREIVEGNRRADSNDSSSQPEGHCP